MALFSSKTEENKKEEAKGPSANTTAVLVPSVLLAPRISEKASLLARVNKYVFNVAPSTNKVEIKKAVERAYKVKVTQVNIIKMEGRTRNYGRTRGKMSNFKKAVVTLKEGDKIEGVTEVA